MAKFYVLQRDFMSAKPNKQFAIETIIAKDSEEAWEIIEGDIATNNSQEWLLTKCELNALRRLLSKGGK